MNWEVVNESYFGKPPYRHTQSSPPSNVGTESDPVYKWTITHDLGLAYPYVASTNFFVDTGGGDYKPIIPSDVTFVNSNSLTVSFTNPYTGYAVVRQ